MTVKPLNAQWLLERARQHMPEPGYKLIDCSPGTDAHHLNEAMLSKLDELKRQIDLLGPQGDIDPEVRAAILALHIQRARRASAQHQLAAIRIECDWLFPNWEAKYPDLRALLIVDRDGGPCQ